MKEYIFQPIIAQDAGVITIADAPTGLTKKNILAIINKTTKGIVHSPLVDGVATVSYAGTELAIILNAGHESIQGNLLIKAYSDEEGSSGDAAEQVKDFFGIVKDGDTVKVVTEDGGEEVVEPVGLMDEDDVYDYLEDIAVLMGGITAQQAASITAATRAIIHGGSGSGEGGEGGSGSGSGE